MLAPTSERIDDALGRLSADDRALLELSLRRGVSDDEIAALLHVHREHVEHRRELALDQLVGDLDSDSRAEVATLVGQVWRTNGAPAPAPPPARPEPRRPHRRVTDVPPSPLAASRRRRRAGLIAAAAAGAAVLVFALSTGGDEPVLGPDPEPAPQAPAPQASGPRAPLGPVTPGSTARGSVQLRGSTLHLRASGLPAGSYAVWLFDDVTATRRIARFDGTEANVRAELPKGYERYRFIDVSSEPNDGNPNHSGASVLRTQLASLTR